MLYLTTVALFDFYQLSGDPNGVQAAKRGSIGLCGTPGNVSTWQNVDGATAWVQLGAGGSGQWTIPSNATPALQIGPAADPDMLGFNTVVGSEVVYIGATQGLRLNDSSPLRFGTPGTDVVFTPDGTDVQVTGTGTLRYVDGFTSVYGTSALDQFSTRYDVVGRLQTTGAAVTAGGATQSTRSMFWSTGSRVKTDNNAGLPQSGSYLWTTGNTDITFVGAATGPDSGNFQWQTGNANASGAGSSSGNTGGFSWFSGNSVSANSGGFSFTTGTAGGTRGVFDINAPAVDLQTQATDFRVLNNSATSLRIGTAGVPDMMVFNTLAGNTITFVEGALSNLNTAVADVVDGAIAAGFWMRQAFPAGAVNTDVVLPARVGGWRVVDAYIQNTSGGAGAGTLAVQTGAGVAISDAMVPGVNHGLTRAAAINEANSTIASGGTLRFAGVAATTSGVAFARIEPL